MKIEVTKLENGLWVVIDGEKFSTGLGYEEMLGLFAALTMPENPNCLNWMKTKSQHESEENYRKENEQKDNLMDVEFEDSIKEENDFEEYLDNAFMIDKDTLSLHGEFPVEYHDDNIQNKWFFNLSLEDKRLLCKNYNVNKINSSSIGMMYTLEKKIKI